MRGINLRHSIVEHAHMSADLAQAVGPAAAAARAPETLRASAPPSCSRALHDSNIQAMLWRSTARASAHYLFVLQVARQASSRFGAAQGADCRGD